ncbi:beta-ketoacyl-ACP synthase II [Chloroflexota bacterium]
MQGRVVITGMGTVNALGLSVNETWENIIKGVSGVRRISSFDPSRLNVQIACEVKDFNPHKYMTPRETRRRDRFEQLAAAAVQEAIQNSGIEVEKTDKFRVGVIISSAMGGLKTLYDAFNTVQEKGSNRVSPFAIPMLMTNGSAGMVAIDYGFQGPCFSVASACASGSDAIGLAWTLLRNNVIDVAVTGASEATITEVGVATFDRVGAMSRRNDDYSMTPQPFDRNRDGLVMGEGAGVIVLEREDFARKRGAQILADLAGYASTADAFHIVAPSENGEGGAMAISLAMKTADINRDEIDYINAHGTGTILNDISETRAIKAAFGDTAYNIPVSSTKSMTGHIMGATGALEVIICVKAIRDGVVPPTIHYQTPDPECDLDYVPNQARELVVQVALSNSFGFGGHNAALIIREYS